VSKRTCVRCGKPLIAWIPADEEGSLKLEPVVLVETEDGHIFGDHHIKCEAGAA
jgi:hypothetical protein